MSDQKVTAFGNIRYYGDGPMLLLGQTITARKQIGKQDIYQLQHHDGSIMGYPYKVPKGVYKRTPAQNQTRLRMRAAMLAWNRVPEYEQLEWKEKAEGKPQQGHNLFASWWLKNHGFGVSAFGQTAFGDSAGATTRKG